MKGLCYQIADLPWTPHLLIHRFKNESVSKFACTSHTGFEYLIVHLLQIESPPDIFPSGRNLQTNASGILQHHRGRILEKYKKRHALQKFQIWVCVPCPRRTTPSAALSPPPGSSPSRRRRAQRLQHPPHTLHITHTRLPIFPIHHDRPLQCTRVLPRQLRDRLRRRGLFLTATSRRRRVRGEEDELRIQRFGGEV